MWQKLLDLPHLGDYLSILGLLLTLLGFAFTIRATLQAKTAAEAAKAAAEQARGQVKKLDLVSELATILQLVEELKRLHRSGAVEFLGDRYSGLRIKVVSIRESGVVTLEEELQLLQDVVVRLSALERAFDKGEHTLSDKKQVARSNDSLSNCSEAIIRLAEKIKLRV